MLKAMINHYTNGNKAKFANLLGVSAQTISAWGTRNTFDSELIYTKCVGVSADWLLTGEGSMLRDNKIPEESKRSSTPISPTEESIIYRMYKEKDEENKVLIRENGRLEERIRQLESQNKESEHPSIVDNITEAFTKESSGDYGEDSGPTKLPSGSKRSSVGKV